jgi:hypothetical protein
MDLVLLDSGTRDASVAGARVMPRRRIPVIDQGRGIGIVRA